MICMGCAFDAAPDFAFCPKCGQRLAAEAPNAAAAPPAPRQPPRDDDADRRPATVLFADLSGFTALSEALDPEEVRALQTELFDAMSAAIDRFDGFVEKFVGDAVMAVFGAPVAHDDDPEVLNAFIEIVPTDTVKYELHKTSGHLHVDRPQRYSSICPTLYGFVPQTYCAELVGARCAERVGGSGIEGDGDPIDICVLTEKAIAHGNLFVRARPIGGLRMVDGVQADDKIVAILEDDRLVELLVDRQEQRRSVGNIYLGRIEAVLPGIQAGFVDIGLEKSAFLHASDLLEPEEDEEEERRARARRAAELHADEEAAETEPEAAG